VGNSGDTIVESPHMASCANTAEAESTQHTVKTSFFIFSGFVSTYSLFKVMKIHKFVH